MTQVTLQQAVSSLEHLPADQKQQIAQMLIEYGPKLAKLRADIDEGIDAMKRGDVTDVTSIDQTVNEIAEMHDRT